MKYPRKQKQEKNNAEKGERAHGWVYYNFSRVARKAKNHQAGGRDEMQDVSKEVRRGHKTAGCHTVMLPRIPLALPASHDPGH